MVNSAAMAAMTATKMHADKVLLNGVNSGGKIGLLGLRITHSTAKKPDITKAPSAATTK